MSGLKSIDAIRAHRRASAPLAGAGSALAMKAKDLNELTLNAKDVAVDANGTPKSTTSPSKDSKGSKGSVMEGTGVSIAAKASGAQSARRPAASSSSNRSASKEAVQSAREPRHGAKAASNGNAGAATAARRISGDRSSKTDDPQADNVAASKKGPASNTKAKKDEAKVEEPPVDQPPVDKIGSNPFSSMPASPVPKSATVPYFRRKSAEASPKFASAPPRQVSAPAKVGGGSVVAEPEVIKSDRTLTSGVQLNHDGKEEIFCVRFSPDSAHIGLSFADGSISVCTTEDGMLRSRLNFHGTCPTTMMRWRPQRAGGEDACDRLVMCASDGSIVQYNVLTRRKYWEILEPDNQLFCMEYRPDGHQFTCAGKLVQCHIYDEETQKQLQILKTGDFKSGGGSGHSNRIFSVKYHPTDPNIIISGSWDRMIQFWDVRAGDAVRSILGPYVCGDSIDISEDGHTVLTGSSRPNNQLQLWDFGSARLLRSIPWEDEDSSVSVLAAQFSKGDNSSLVMAGGSGSSIVKLFDSKTNWASFGEIDLGKNRLCYCCDFSPDGTMLAAGGSESHVQVMQLK